MTATYRPIRCPHGADLTAESADNDTLCGVYTDGCRSNSGIPPLFWCGPDEMSKPNGVSIYEGEYLRDWQDAIDEEFHRWTAETKQREDCLDLEAAHAEALILNAGDELYDEATEIDDAMGSGNGVVAHIYGHAQDPHPESCDACAHAMFLGEVPWSDRIEEF